MFSESADAASENPASEGIDIDVVSVPRPAASIEVGDFEHVVAVGRERRGESRLVCGGPLGVSELAAVGLGQPQDNIRRRTEPCARMP